MNGNNDKVTLNVAGASYLASLSREECETSQQEVSHFVRWFNSNRLVSTFTPHDVEDYAENLSASTTDYTQKIKIVKAFLQYLKKKSWTAENLAPSLKHRKARVRVPAAAVRRPVKTISVTQQGSEEMKLELEKLKEKSFQVIEDIRRAAADKDLSENAPYHAAREQKSRLDGRIMELEETLKTVVIIDEKPKTTQKATIGDTVRVKDLDSKEELCYTLVNPRDVNPSRGRISLSSPIGSAIAGHREGDVIEVTAPACKMRYQITHLGK
jgi:transcription elongation factor GreA